MNKSINKCPAASESNRIESMRTRSNATQRARTSSIRPTTNALYKECVIPPPHAIAESPPSSSSSSTNGARATAPARRRHERHPRPRVSSKHIINQPKLPSHASTGPLPITGHSEIRTLHLNPLSNHEEHTPCAHTRGRLARRFICPVPHSSTDAMPPAVAQRPNARVPLNDFENLAVGAFGGIVETCVQSAWCREAMDG